MCTLTPFFNLLEKYNERVQKPLESIREHIRKADVAHFDETGFRVGSTRWWNVSVL